MRPYNTKPIRLTRWAQEWAQGKVITAAILARGKEIALEDHRGLVNTQDLEQAYLERPRKFYIGDKVEILNGEHGGKTMLICALANSYVAGAIDGVTTRIDKAAARIVSR